MENIVQSSYWILFGVLTREKGRDLTQSYDKSPYTNGQFEKRKVTTTTKNATKNVDYTGIADRLRKVSWSNVSQPTGVVQPVYGITTFPLSAKAL